MPPKIVHTGNTMNYTQLQGVMNKMNAKVGNSYIEKQNGSLYLNPTSALQPYYRDKFVFARGRTRQTKQLVGQVISDRIGPQATKRILRQNKVHEFRQDDKGKFLNENGDCLTKKQLGDVQRDVAKHELEQHIANLTPSERKNLTDRLNALSENPLKMSEAMDHPQLGSIFRAHVVHEYAGENLPLYEAGCKLEKLLARYENATDADKPKILKMVRDSAVEAAGFVEGSNVDSRSTKAFAGQGGEPPEYTAADIQGMDFNAIAKLVRGNPENVGSRTGLLGKGLHDVASNLRDSFMRFRTEFPKEVSKVNDREQLQSLHDSMGQDDHLRTDGHTLYSKGSHRGGSDTKRGLKFNRGKQHFWGGSRAKKFAGAKVKVQAKVANMLNGDSETAARIMQPFLASKKALTKADIGLIIAAADAAIVAKAKVAQLVRSDQPQLPAVQNMAKGTDIGWSDAFHTFAQSRQTSVTKHVEAVHDLSTELLSAKVFSHSDDFGTGYEHELRNDQKRNFETCQQKAADLLQTKGLPRKLRNSLEAFVALTGPKSHYTELRNELNSYGASQIQNGSEYQKLHVDFSVMVESERATIPQPEPSVASETSVSEVAASPSPVAQEPVQSDIVNINDVDMENLEPDDDIRPEVSVSYNPGLHAPIVPSNDDPGIDWEIEIDSNGRFVGLGDNSPGPIGRDESSGQFMYSPADARSFITDKLPTSGVDVTDELAGRIESDLKPFFNGQVLRESDLSDIMSSYTQLTAAAN